MINHSQFCFRGILWFSHKIAPYSVGCPTFGVQSKLLAGPTDSRSLTSRPGKAPAATRHKAAPYPLSSPGGAALTGPTRCEPVRGPCRPGKAQPPPGEISAQSEMSLLALRLAGLQLLCYFRTDCAPNIFSALCHSWRWERTGGGQSPPPPVPPGSGQQHRHCVVPSTYPCRLRVGPRQRPCKTRPSTRIHAG
ncbi:Uncharacterised protein [Klebsiella pneumoniae]|nr:Uncharacterised protein [Klebsiella pneumoniae]SBY81158.1 Uncharacterised protein [Klebsiella pneumoniae]SBY99671.1 Uncharacterised protein [Klebsiella pneumoniae]SBZ41235.1 Uncharacterised protein [Klebsiella pneumoniae]SCA68973.1 Uncharacterised protein [Klebsiella pneumoniae]